MGIRIIRNGRTYRRWWYAEYRDGGKLCRVKLDVRVSGKPPSSFSMKDEGDTLFETSKAKAQKVFDDFMLSRQQKGNAEPSRAVLPQMSPACRVGVPVLYMSGANCAGQKGKTCRKNGIGWTRRR